MFLQTETVTCTDITRIGKCQLIVAYGYLEKSKLPDNLKNVQRQLAYALLVPLLCQQFFNGSFKRQSLKAKLIRKQLHSHSHLIDRNCSCEWAFICLVYSKRRDRSSYLRGDYLLKNLMCLEHTPKQRNKQKDNKTKPNKQ